MTNKIQLCLVSKQAAANLVPICDERFKPKKVILLVSSLMVNEASYLKNVFEEINISDIEIINFNDAFDFEEVRSNINEIVQNHKEDEIELNITGGNPLCQTSCHPLVFT